MKIDRKRTCARNTAEIIAAQSEDLQTSKREISSKKFRCVTCHKKFSSRGNLKAHQRIHSGEKLFRCNECNKSFSYPGNLTVHKRIHANIKPYQCEDCGKTFSAKGNLLAHVRTHTGSKPFKCKECGKEFSHKGNLNAHMRLHSGLKPFICSYCNKSFAHKGNMNAHLKVHGKPVTYSCEICPKVFSKQRLLKKHLHQHSSVSKTNKAITRPKGTISKADETVTTHTHKSNDCIKMEESKKIQDLQQDHMKLNWKSKHFTCPECNKGFLFKRSLTIHMKVHGKPSVYSCEICPKVFSERRLLKKHLEQHFNPAKANDALLELLAGENISLEPGISEMACSTDCAKLDNSNTNNLISLSDTVGAEVCKSISEQQLNQDGKDKQLHCSQECVVCGQRFFDEQKLEIHLRSHLPSSNVFRNSYLPK